MRLVPVLHRGLAPGANLEERPLERGGCVMRRTARLLLAIGLAAACGGEVENGGDGVEGSGRDWDADTICDEPGLEWACEELPPKEEE